MHLSRLSTALLALSIVAAPGLLSAQSNPFPDLRYLDAQYRNGSYLGVALSDIDADRANTLKLGEPRGVEVVRVEVGSPADRAGLKAGDVLLSYNGENILGAQHLGRLVSETPVGRHIKIQYWRDGHAESTVVTTASAQHPNVRLVPLTNIDTSDSRMFPMMMDIPSPLMIWKNSMLGVLCEPLDAQLAQYFGVKNGILIRSVEKESPGDKAGIRAGDVLVSIDNVALAGPKDLNSFTRSQRQPRNSVPVKLIRDHKELNLNVAVARPGE